MQWRGLSAQLEAAFRTPALRGEDGAVYIPDEVFDLDAAVHEVVGEQCAAAGVDDDDAGSPLDDCHSFDYIRQIGPQIGWSLTTAVSFRWDAFGPISWAADLQLLNTGTQVSYVCMQADEEIGLWRALAAIDPGNSAPAFSECFKQLLAENTLEFASLPSSTVSQAPHLIDAGTIKQAYFDFVDSEGPYEHGDWGDLLHSLAEWKKDHLSKSLSLLHRRLSSLRDGDDDEVDDLTEVQKHRILDAYFRLSYSEIINGHPGKRKTQRHCPKSSNHASPSDPGRNQPERPGEEPIAIWRIPAYLRFTEGSPNAAEFLKVAALPWEERMAKTRELLDAAFAEVVERPGARFIDVTYGPGVVGGEVIPMGVLRVQAADEVARQITAMIGYVLELDEVNAYEDATLPDQSPNHQHVRKNR